MADFSFIQEAFGEDNEMKTMFLNSLKIELKTYQQAIITAIKDLDKQAFEETAHKFKPQALQLGETDFLELLGQCENRFGTNNSNELERVIQVKFEKLIDEISRELEQIST